MRKVLGTCDFCNDASVFEVLNIIHQIEKMVLAECQCCKCSQRVFINFEVTGNNYGKIEAVGERMIDGDSSPHSSPELLIP